VKPIRPRRKTGWRIGFLNEKIYEQKLQDNIDEAKLLTICHSNLPVSGPATLRGCELMT